jgi:hypothetical protein
MMGGDGGWGEIFRGRWTRAWIFVSGLKAFVVSSVSLSSFYYKNIISMLFIMQAFLVVGFSRF